jgi:4a-hydroxytetrahydrobiopterin dehydratase
MSEQGATLDQQRCVPCEGGVPALGGAEAQALAGELGSGWRMVRSHHLEKEYRFLNFADALHFANQVGQIAEAEGHHPDLLVGWGRVKVYLWTHAVDGLTKNDFVLAAKIEKLVQQPLA